MRKKRCIKLSEAQRMNLEGLTKAGECRVRVYKRARALLLADAGVNDSEILKQADISLATLKRIRKRFCESQSEVGEVVEDRPKPGRPSRFSGEARAKITALACSDAPEGRSRWTLRLLADKAVELGLVETISHEGISEILKKTSLSRISKDNGASAS